MLEVEVKIKVNIAEIEDKLISAGFVKASNVYEADTYFNSEHMDLKKADKALRIRTHKNLDSGVETFILNFKGPKLDDTTMTREETEFEIPSYEAGATLLGGLGFSPAGSVEKHRISYTRDNITCCLDSVTGLGEFLEVEIIAEDSAYDESIDKIKGVLDILGLDMGMSIQESYLCMLQNNR